MNLLLSSPLASARRLGAAAVLLALWAAPCHAALVTHSFSFTAKELFTVSGPDFAPVDPISGMVTVTFDASVTRVDQTTGVVLNSINLPTPTSPVAYTYRADFDKLIVGGVFANANGIRAGEDDFFVVFDGATSLSPTFSQFAYALVDFPLGVWTSFSGSVTRGDPVPDPGPTADVPEPTSLALVLTAALAAGLRRGRSRVGGATPVQAR